MGKALSATCVAGIVTAEGVPVPSTTILSKGVGQSSGVLIMEESQKTYVANTSADLETTLTKLVASLNNIVTVLTALDSAVLSGANAATIAQITASAVELNTLKANLK